MKAASEADTRLIGSKFELRRIALIHLFLQAENRSDSRIGCS
jgi:hypothetical protein